MHEVTITGLTRITEPKPNKGGSTVLAWFDCDTGSFALQGCAFVRTARRGLTVWPPKIDGKEGARRAVAITDESLRKAMVSRAQETYRALGGTDGEWIRADEADAGEAAGRYSRENTTEEREAEEREEGASIRREVKVRRRPGPIEVDQGLQRFISGAS